MSMAIEEPRARHWAREDAAEAKERDARALAITTQQSQRDVLKLRREREAKEREWARWDRLLASEPFADFLSERGWEVRETNAARFVAWEAESAALGAMLMDERAAAYAARTLHATHFHTALHGRIFEGIIGAWRQYMARRQARQNVGYDFVFIVEYFRAARLLEKCCGANYLAALIESCPGAANVAAYCESVIEAAGRRALHATGEALVQAVCAEDGKRFCMAKCGTENEPTHAPAYLSAALKKFCDALKTMGGGTPAPDLMKILEETK